MSENHSLTDAQAATIAAELEDEYPALEIWSGVYVFPSITQRVWCAQSRERGNNPWFVMSADLERFKRWLAE